MFSRKKSDRKYKENNREKIREQNKKYYKKNFKKIREHMKEYYQREEVKKHRKEYRKQYYIKNKEKELEQNNQWRKDNSERVKENVEQWKKNNPKKIKQYQKKYRQNNMEKVKENYNQYTKNKRRIDLKYNLNRRIGNAIWWTLKDNKNDRHWENLLGYSVNDLIKRLQKTMPQEYTWKDYLNGKLHIDHIIPISAHNFTKPENPDFKKCWALNNLRLLPAKENLIKGSKLTRPFQPALKI